MISFFVYYDRVVLKVAIEAVDIEGAVDGLELAAAVVEAAAVVAGTTTVIGKGSSPCPDQILTLSITAS